MAKLNHEIFADRRVRGARLLIAGAALLSIAAIAGNWRSIFGAPADSVREAYDARRYDDAVSLAEAILREEPSSPEALVGLSAALTEKAILGQEPENSARDAVTAALAAVAASDRPEPRLALGRALFASGDVAAARSELVSARRAHPQNPEIAALLGEVLLAAGEIREGGEMVREAFLADPSSVEVRLAYARSLAALRELDAAADAALPVAEDRRPRLAAEANLIVASALVTVGRVDEARPAARRALELAPDSALASQVNGEVVFAELLGPYGRNFDQALDEAGSHADTAIRLDPRRALPYLLAFKIAHARGDDGDAARRAAAARERLTTDLTVPTLQRGEILAFISNVLAADATPTSND